MPPKKNNTTKTSTVKNEKLPLNQAWENWVHCLKGDDTNSIFQQISSMVWDTAIFRLIVEGRQIQIEKNSHAPAVNGSLHSFIDRNYFQSQTAFIRRLTDQSYRFTGNKGVYSVSSLIDDIRSYRDELTREMFFNLRKMSYDYAEIRNKQNEFIRNQAVGKAFFIPHEFDWETIAETHQTFDRLSSATQEDRQPTDVIDEKVFIRLREKVVTCQEITNYVDKFVAHSATPESRAIQNISASEITFKHLWDAHQIIFEVAEFLSVILFSEGHMALEIENQSFLEFWDTPIYEKNEEIRIREIFENYRKETEEWNLNGIEHTWQWIES